MQGEGHENALDARLGRGQAELGAAVVEQVELHVAPTTNQLPFTVASDPSGAGEATSQRWGTQIKSQLVVIGHPPTTSPVYCTALLYIGDIRLFIRPVRMR